MKSLFVALLISLLPGTSFAVETGKPLPVLDIPEKGEIMLDAKGEETSFKPWSSDQIDTTEKVQIVQYMAGRPSSEKLIRVFADQLDEQKFSPDYHQVTSIVNLDDVTFGASSFALSELKKNKKRYPQTSLVADKDGDGIKVWNLKRKSAALIILDESGNVAFFNQGKFSQAQVDQAIGLIRSGIEQRKTAQ